MPDINLGLGASLPGEQIAVALMNYASKVRETMDPALTKRLDTVTVRMVEDSYETWRDLWVKAGVIKDPK